MTLRLKPFFCCLFMLLVPMLVFRIYTLISIEMLTGPLDAGGALLRGFLSDLCIALLLANLLVVFRDGWSLKILFCFITGSLVGVNLEHISVNLANLDFSFFYLAISNEFIFGSVITAPVLTKVFLAIALGLAVIVGFEKMPLFAGDGFPITLVSSLVVLITLAIWPVEARYPNWVQMNVLEENATRLLAIGESAPLVEEVTDVPALARDLSGELFVNVGSTETNVLLIMVEGLSARMTEYGYLPELTQLAESGVRFDNFYAHQKQTDRGTYAILCGDYPNMATKESKMQLVGARDAPDNCLTHDLNNAGYRTVYLQSAPIGFMSKDVFMQAIGFDEIYDNREMPEAYASSPWGVDDRRFYEEIQTKVKRLESEGQPWMLTALTSGTHHPYIVPDDVAAQDPSLETAFRYSDQYLVRLIKQLKTSGILDTTVVIITSDEAAGLPDSMADTSMEDNRLFTLVLTPGRDQHRVSEVFGQVDVRLSIHDFLGLTQGDAIGRSLFRSYPSQRELVAGNVYLDRIYMKTSKGQDLTCDTSFSDCLLSSGNNAEQSEQKLRAFVRLSDVSSLSDTRTRLTEESGKVYVDNPYVLSEFNMEAAVGDEFEWELRVSSPDPSATLTITMAATAWEDSRLTRGAKLLDVKETVTPGNVFAARYVYRAEKAIPWIRTNYFVQTDSRAGYLVEQARISITRSH